MEIRCHQDLQMATGSGPLSAYVAKYNATFSDAMQDNLLNDAADGDAIAVSVLMRYKPMEPEMVLHLLNHRFRQWHLSTATGGKRNFMVPWPDKEPLPENVVCYMESEWRRNDMNLLQFLRKTNAQGTINKWLRQKHQRLAQQGDEQDLQSYANSFVMNGEQVVACHMNSTQNDRYYGQWLVLHVPFCSMDEFALARNVADLVPEQFQYLARALQCSHPTARRMWHDPLALAAALEKEAYHKDMIAEGVSMHVALKNLVEQDIDGTHEAPVPLPSIRTGAADIKHRLPLQRTLNQCIRDGRKIIEARIKTGQAASTREGDIVLLGCVTVRILEIYHFNSFESMIEGFGVASVLPQCNNVEEALAIYNGFRNYGRLQRKHGVVTFRTEPILEPEVNVNLELMNPEQRTVHRIVVRNAERAVRYYAYLTHEDAASTKAEMMTTQAMILTGPQGSGKTFVMHNMVKLLGNRRQGVIVSSYSTTEQSHANLLRKLRRPPA